MEERPRRRVFRFVTIAVLACAPLFAVLGAVGCSDDEDPVGMVSVDPGGTYGAEVSLAVTGRGRVISTTGTTIDCPTKCYGRFVVDDSSSPIQNVKLKAVPTPGARFLGWSFESEPLGTRGRGPDRCNPVSRPSVSPAVDPSALEITLPFGEVNGTPPTANAGECAANYAVPLAYRVVAKFESDVTIVDAGADGGDGGGGEVFAEPQGAGSIAREIGLVGSQYLVWRWDQAGFGGVSMAIANGGAAQIVQSPSSAITVFEVDTAGAVWQRSDGSLYYLLGGAVAPVALSGAPTCVALAMDTSGIHCRTAGPNGTIVSWTTGGVGPTLQYSFLPTGTDLYSDTSYFFFSGDTAVAGGASVYYGTRAGPGDAGSFNIVASGRTGVRNLQGNTSRLFWIETSGGLSTANANSSRFSSSVFTSVGPQPGIAFLAPDPSSTYLWAASTSTIWRGIYSGGTPTTFRSGLTGIGGIAVDSFNAYWTQSDGRVYRASRSGI